MIAALCTAYGPPENLALAELADPEPGLGEILVAPTRVGLNFFDTLIIENKYQVKPDLPFSPGGEFCGHILALGGGVRGLRIGQRVAGYCSYGAARSRLVVPASSIAPTPDSLSDDQAAGLFVTYGTTLHALRQRANLQKGETLAVLGASGGVGIAAVEIGAALGARVIACASSPEKLQFARKYGAQEAVDYSIENLKDALKALTGGAGIDCVYDPIGGEFSELALRALGWKGRLLVVGFASGEIPKIPLNLALLKGCDILGIFWSEFVKREPKAHLDNMARIFEWTAQGVLSAHVQAVYPLADIAEALRVLKSRKAQGKILLSIPQ